MCSYPNFLSVARSKLNLCRGCGVPLSSSFCSVIQLKRKVKINIYIGIYIKALRGKRGTYRDLFKSELKMFSCVFIT